MRKSLILLATLCYTQAQTYFISIENNDGSKQRTLTIPNGERWCYCLSKTQTAVIKDIGGGSTFLFSSSDCTGNYAIGTGETTYNAQWVNSMSFGAGGIPSTWGAGVSQKMSIARPIVMKRFEDSKRSNKEAWKNEIDTTRAGAGYFLAFKGKPEFKPMDYVAFRALTLSKAQHLLPAEWIQWIQDLKTSPYEHVRRRAISAPILTVDDIYNFYKTRIVDSHELEILGESSRQVVSGGHDLASLLQSRQTTSSSATNTTPAPVPSSLDAVSLASQKHPRSPSCELDEVPPKPYRNKRPLDGRASASSNNHIKDVTKVIECCSGATYTGSGGISTSNEKPTQEPKFPGIDAMRGNEFTVYTVLINI
ncbi:hypothetical protein FBU30_009381 [Linnemannia zychae]|nr:hypothetical protein FBU30_009381 [Linnemannia zychae]